MAILWQKTLDGTRYEVRSAGNTRRLYTDGVFHSQYNPGQPLTGGIWDLLWLPAFFKQLGSIRRVLVLGVGGGAVIRQLNRYIEPAEIVGIELNPVHLQVAKKYFAVDSSAAELHQADAVQWLKDYRGPKFDLIIDDLFGEKDGEPSRAVEADAGWFRLLDKNLGRQGILVMNFIGSVELRTSAYVTHSVISNRFSAAYQFTLPLYENVIAAFLRQDADTEQLRQRLAGEPGLRAARSREQLKFHTRKIRPMK